MLPGQYYDQETGLHYNYFRDYDPSIGRYIESDSLGIKGQITRKSMSARIKLILDRYYDMARDKSEANNLKILAFIDTERTPETILYGYTGGNPLKYKDPTGEFGLFEFAAIAIGGAAAAIVIYAIYDCVKKCDSDQICPYPRNSGDPETDQNRNAWVLGCKTTCVRTFGELAKGGPW